ncbi:EAL domain-containing protein [Marinobacter nauticus]|uniref:bifunctional diguanylate cyclase/phosphodiesterase n=1 Tax=Marinobacter nauticus TaxID=2743 RepID=UPI001CD1F1A0|nr:EAL domain-containing protein [Marinobacter nauticus]MCA0913198.1 EAL domain-containing protein [Marinobacter nauticus]
MAGMLDNFYNRRQRGEITLQTLLLLFAGTLLTLTLVVAFVTSYGYFRGYVADQLSAHARDGATATGLSLSNAIDGSDPVASASLIDAVFDSGRYLAVEYRGHDGEMIAGRRMPLQANRAPEWFVSLAALPLPVAEAEVVRGWSRLGKVRVVSHPGRAYDDLWHISLGLLLSALVIATGGLLGLFLLLRRTLRPLKEVEAQARALGQRDFRKRVSIRSTRELNRVTEAMNQMADDLGQLFEGQGKLIQHLRRVNNEDPVTGLASRSAFDQRMKVEVESEEKSAPGVLIMLQLAYFADYNLAYGRDEGDRLLRQVAGGIRAFVARHAESFAGRRTGAEFAVFVPGASAADVRIWAEQLVQELDGIYSDLSAPMDAHVHAGLAVARPDEGVRALLAAADEALRAAQQREESCSLLLPDSGVENHHNMETWRTIIAQAIREDNLSLWLQPMVHGNDQSLVHYQVFSRIETAEGPLKAGLFVPMAERLGLVSDIDRMLLTRALECLERHPERRLAVSLGSSSIASDSFRDDLLSMVAKAGRTAGRLWVGIAEVTIHHHRKAVSSLIRELSRLGVPVLVDRFGVGGVPFSYLKRLPFRAVRIDHSFIHNLDRHDENRFWLESVVGIAHSRGVKVYATGVETAAEYSVLCRLGIDGAMGYHLGRPFAADT